MHNSQQDDLFFLGQKLILRNPQGLILLLKMQKNNVTFWELPGGRLQLEETELEGLKREVLEETGISDIKNIQHLDMYLSRYRNLSNYNIEAGFIFSMYTGTTNTDKVVLSNDHIDYGWFAEHKAIDLLGEAYGRQTKYLIMQNSSII